MISFSFSQKRNGNILASGPGIISEVAMSTCSSYKKQTGEHRHVVRLSQKRS